MDISIAGSIEKPKGVVTLVGEHLEYKEMQLGFLALQGEFEASQEIPGKLESLHFIIPEFWRIQCVDGPHGML